MGVRAALRTTLPPLGAPFVATMGLFRQGGRRERSPSRGFFLPTSCVLFSSRLSSRIAGSKPSCGRTERSFLPVRESIPHRQRITQGYSVCHGNAWHSPKTFNMSLSAAVQPHIWKKPSMARGHLGSMAGRQGRHLFRVSRFASCI